MFLLSSTPPSLSTDCAVKFVRGAFLRQIEERAGSGRLSPDSLFPIGANLCENYFCRGVCTCVHGIVFSADRAHRGNSLRSQLHASVHQRKPRGRAHASAMFRGGAGLRDELARGLESGSRRIYLHLAGDFIRAPGGAGAPQTLAGARPFALFDFDRILAFRRHAPPPLFPPSPHPRTSNTRAPPPPFFFLSS